MIPAQDINPWQQATLYRDDFGVPHIYAENFEALGFAFGYAQAEDHLSDMLLAYRVANGRAAEVLGEAYAASDAFSIKIGHADLANNAWNTNIDALTAALCSGFARGVNLWIVEHPDRTPTWAEGVKPQDILALWHAYLMSFAPMDVPEVWRRAPAAHSGNAWAVAPFRNESGNTMLVINPHQYYDGVFKWYEAHLIMPGYNMYGATLYGLPVILQGHNGLLGWALTPNQPDSADVYKEPITEAANNPNELGNQLAAIPQRTGVLLEYVSRARPFYVRTAGGLEERQVSQWIVDHGPVLDAGSDFFYTWRVGGYQNFGGLAQLFQMGAATTLEAFQNAMYAQQLPCFHVVYADQAGNLFYLYNAISGIRDTHSLAANIANGLEPFNWKMPTNPFNDHIFWGDVFLPGELPYLTNPESGYIQACGNPPWTATDNPPFTADMWPYWLSEDANTYRALRVRELLRSGMRNFQDMQNMLYDDVLPAAKDMVALLLLAADNNADFVRSAHPDLGAALEALRNWDMRANTDATAMTFYHLWWAMLQAKNPFGVDSNIPLYQALLQNAPDTQQLILNAAADAVRLLRNQYDSVEIPWGEVHRLVRGTEEVPFAGSGSGEPIFVSSDYAYKDDRWQVTYGYGFAMAVEFGELPRAVSIVPFGASESPTSKHYADQLELFSKKQFKPTHFLMEDVARHARQVYGSSITLYPKGVDGALYILANSAVQANVTTLTESPVPLPEGAAAFTLFAQPQLEPKNIGTMIQYDVRISSTLCAPENLYQLGLYAYNEGRGWTPFEEQYADPALQVISGRTPYPAMFAVLGPEALLQTSFDPQMLLDADTSFEGETIDSDINTEEEFSVLPDDLYAPQRTFSLLRDDLPEGKSPENIPDTAPPNFSMGNIEQRTFKFERLDLPEGLSTAETIDGKSGGVVMTAPQGQRQFKFIRNDQPKQPAAPAVENETPNAENESGEEILKQDMPEEVATPQAPQPQNPAPTAENEPEGPKGKKQFKFEKKD